MQGVSWSADNRLYTCGWDGKVFTHTLTEPVQGHMTGEPVQGHVTGGEIIKMEVNGFSTEQKDSVSQKCILNDSGDANQTNCNS